ncbi:MAG: AAA family ATPase [Candidatus Micrarchaeia archaeon]
MMLCIVGYMGSGKSTAAVLLKRRGFKIIEMGDTVREEMKKNGMEINSKSVRAFAAGLRQQYGNDIVARLASKKLDSFKNVVIVGVRSTYERDYFKKLFSDFVVVAIVAPERMRFSRIRKRRKPDDPKTLAEFRKIEAKERSGFESKRDEAHGIGRIIDEADYVLFNTATVSQLSKDVASLLTYLKGGAAKSAPASRA